MHCPSVNKSSNEDGGWCTIPAWAGLFSSLLSVVGCVLILISYQRYREFRTGSRKVAVCLAVSNLFLALGYVVGSLNLIIYQANSDCDGFSAICPGQAFVTWWFALASFVWTTILAFYLFVTLVNRTIHTANHWGAWIAYVFVSLAVPLVTTVIVAGFKRFGYSPYATGASCFISTALNKSSTSEYGFNAESVSLISLVKGIEVMSYVIVIFLFGVIQYKIVTAFPSSEQLSQREASSYGVPRRREWRLLTIPVFFVSLRIWGTIATVVSIALFYDKPDKNTSCISGKVSPVLFCLDLLQAIGDPGLGWANSVLFIFLSPKVRQKMFGSCLNVFSRLWRSSSSYSSLPANVTSPNNVTSPPMRTSNNFTSYSCHSATDFESFVSSNLFFDRNPACEADTKAVDECEKKPDYKTFDSASGSI